MEGADRSLQEVQGSVSKYTRFVYKTVSTALDPDPAEYKEQIHSDQIYIQNPLNVQNQ